MSQKELQNYQFSQFKVIKKLSRQIYQVQHRITSIYYSLRILTHSETYPFINILRDIDENNNIQKSISIWQEYGKTYVLQEWEVGGDLEQVIKQVRNFSESEIWSFCFEISSGLLHIHEKCIVHRDIKPSNIFVNAEGKYKIADFAAAIYENQINPISVLDFGTPHFIAPEVHRKENYDTKIDIWALGCVVYQMINKNVPFEGTTFNSLQYNIMYRSYSPLSGKWSQQLRFLVDCLLEKQPKKRPNVYQVLQMCRENYDKSAMSEDYIIRITSESIIKIYLLQKARRQSGQQIIVSVPLKPVGSSIHLNQSASSSQQEKKNKFDFGESDIMKHLFTKEELPKSQNSSSLSELKQRPQTAQVTIRKPDYPRVLTARPKDQIVKVQDVLFRKIKQVRPNSAINLSGKQFIQNSLMVDAQQRRIQNVDKQLEEEKNQKIHYIDRNPVTKIALPTRVQSSLVFLREPQVFHNQASHNENDMDESDRKHKLARVKYVKRESNPLTQYLTQAANVYTQKKTTTEKKFSEKRTQTQKESKQWQDRINSATLMRK